VDERVTLIKKKAALAISNLGPLSDVAQFGLNRESVEWVEGYIERQRAQPGYDAKIVSGLVNVLGSFLGECVIAATGGSWQWSEEMNAPGILFGNNTYVFPFVKVGKLFANGLEGGDSILSFYDIAVDYVATGKLNRWTPGSQSRPPE
jgi:hypothetical protein